MDPTEETQSDLDVRLDALDRAIKFHATRDCDPDQCMDTAQKFERYLIGSNATADQPAQV